MSLPVSRNTNYGIGVACIVFLVIAAWFGLPVLSDMASYADWDKPAEIAKLREALVFGGVGFLLSLGVNIFDIVRPVLSLVPGMDRFLPVAADTVSDEKRADLNQKAGV